MTKQQLLNGLAETLKKSDDKEQYKEFIRKTLFSLRLYNVRDYLKVLAIAEVK